MTINVSELIFTETDNLQQEAYVFRDQKPWMKSEELGVPGSVYIHLHL